MKRLKYTHLKKCQTWRTNETSQSYMTMNRGRTWNRVLCRAKGSVPHLRAWTTMAWSICSTDSSTSRDLCFPELKIRVVKWVKWNKINVWNVLVTYLFFSLLSRSTRDLENRFCKNSREPSSSSLRSCRQVRSSSVTISVLIVGNSSPILSISTLISFRTSVNAVHLGFSSKTGWAKANKQD